MEFVAAVASVAQLTRYAIYLIAAVCEIQEKIERRPVLVDQQVEQLTRLRSTIESINQNEALGTSVVREILEAIIKRISFLHLLLKKEIEKQARGFLRKYYEAYIGGDRTEKRIVDIFGDLEKDKISLLLSIAEIHAGLSSRIHTTLTEGFSSGKGEDSPNKATRSHSEAVMCKEVPANSSAKMSAEKSAQVNNAATSANPPTEKECQSGHETPNPELSSTHNRKSHETEGLDISTHSSPSSENMQG